MRKPWEGSVPTRETGFETRATSEACHFLQGESPCLEFKE